MSNILRGLRLAFRSLRKSPGFTLLVISAWAIGIGATTALFSIYKSVLLHPLPYHESAKLVLVNGEDKDGPEIRASYATYVDWQQQKNSFVAMGTFRGWSPTLVSNGSAEPLHGVGASASFFDVLMVQPLHGRLFNAQEDAPNTAKVVVLSYGMWRRLFGGDPSIVDKTILLNSKPYRVIGILPPTFNPVGLDVFGREPDIWAPLGYSLALPEACRDCNHLQVLARLKPDVEPERATAEMNSIQRVLNREYPTKYSPDTKIVLLPLKDAVIGNVRLMLTILLASVAFLLLLVCANISHLLLLRATKRSRDIAIRTALGAKRWDVIREFLSESVTLAVLGGAMGLLLAIAAVKAVVILAPAELPRINELSVDAGGFAFAVLVSFLVGVLAGLAPTFAVPSLNLHTFLKEGGRSSSTGSHPTFRKTLMVTEIGLALTLIISAGLFVKSYILVTKVNPGFEASGVLSLNISTQGENYKSSEQTLAFFRQVLTRVDSLPGTQAASLVSTLPISGDFDQFNICIEGKMLCTSPDLPSADRYVITPDYLKVMRIPLLKGRNFTEEDGPSTTPVALVGEAFAHQLFHGEEALGRRIQAGGTSYTVVGVVGDVHQYGLDSPVTSEFYVAFAQQPSSAATLLLRSGLDPEQAGSAARRAIAGIDSLQPVFDIRTLPQLLHASTGHRRFVMLLATIFGSLALFLATMGVYGVVSYAVSQRTQEMGLRMAFGAGRANIFKLVIGEASTIIGVGLGVGLIGVIALSRLMASVLFNVTAFDPLILVGTTLCLLSVALLACSLPALRATLVDPLVALRYE